VIFFLPSSSDHLKGLKDSSAVWLPGGGRNKFLHELKMWLLTAIFAGISLVLGLVVVYQRRILNKIVWSKSMKIDDNVKLRGPPGGYICTESLEVVCHADKTDKTKPI
jgi:hypothetical protein